MELTQLINLLILTKLDTYLEVYTLEGSRSRLEGILNENEMGLCGFN